MTTPPEPLAPELLDAAKREYRLLRRLVIASLGLTCALLFSLNLVDPDLWGHVRYGQDWIREGQLPRTSTHTFTAEGHPWVNHENLAELAFAWGFDHLGVTPMMALKSAWGLLIVTLMLLVARRHNVRLLTAVACATLMAVGLQAFFPMRPQLFSLMSCAVTLLLLDRAFYHSADATDEQINWKWLLAAPVIMVVWTNAHGGFLAGVAIVVARLGGEALLRLQNSGKTALPTASGLAAIATATTLATLVNPYGWELVRWVVSSLLLKRPEITEWAAPKPSDPVFMPLVLLIASAVLSFAATRKKRNWVEFAIFLLVTWQATQHLRHIAFVALLFGFWFTRHVDSALAAVREQAAAGLGVARLSPLVRGGAILALSGAIAVQGVALYDRVTNLPVFRNMYPVDAFEFMAEHDLQGKLVVPFNWAQYALAAFAPQITVSFDGRFDTCYPKQVIDMNFDLLLGDNHGLRHRAPESGPFDDRRALSYGKPDLVMVDRNYKHLVKVVHAELQPVNSGWTLIYQDALAQLWGRTSKYGDPASRDYLAESQRIIGEHASNSSVSWPAYPTFRQPDPAPTDEIALGSSPD